MGRSPEWSPASIVNLLPTAAPTLVLPTYPAIPTTFQIFSDISSNYDQFTSIYTITSVRPNKPYEATQTPNFIPHGGRNIPAAVVGAAGAISTLVILLIMAGICLMFCRRSRKRRLANQRGGQTAEMTQTRSNNNEFAEARAYIRPPSTEPPSTFMTPSTTGSSSNQNLTMPEPPVLLSTTMDQSYYTGIDTSDNLSMVDSRRMSVATAAPGYTASISEPPPPYRPRSVVSRESSMRMSVAPPSYGPRLSIRSSNLNIVRSPFDDPEEDSPVSEIAPSPTIEASQVRDMEEMSDVSELSYQEDPVEARSTV